MGNLEETIKALQKKFGKNYIITGTELLKTDYKRHSLGIFGLDYAIGGGLPEKKILMLAGKEGSGKTSTALITTAAIQKTGGKVAWLIIEYGFDYFWATKLGVQVDKLLIAQPKTIEEISDTVEPLIMTRELDLIVIDSIASASSDKELEESAEDYTRGGIAKIAGVMARKMVARLNDPSNPNIRTSVILLNQIREKMNVIYGNPNYTPGGHALHHQSDIIIWLSPESEPLGGKENPIGLNIKFRITKNRTAPPFKTGVYGLLFEGGVEERQYIIELGIILGIIQKEGYKYTFQDKSVTDIRPFIKSLTDEDWNYIKKQILEKKEIVNIDIPITKIKKEVNSNLEGVV